MTVARSKGTPQNYTICTSSTRPSSPTEGNMIYEADTKQFYSYNGSMWVLINVGVFDVITWI